MSKTHGITAVFSKMVLVKDTALLFIKVRENLRIMEICPFMKCMKVKFVKSAP